MPSSPSPATSPSHPCTARTSRGSNCKAWAVKGSHPPRCAAHGGASRPVGAPRGNQNALKHGAYSTRPVAPPRPGGATIEEIIQDLAERHAKLSAYIESRMEELQLAELVSLLRLHGQNASRLGRLLRDQRALSGEAADGIAGAIAQALDELGTEWGVDL